MANYPYIIASFPDLLLDFERHPLDVDSTVAEVKGQLSEKDCRLVDWLEFGLDGSHLSPHFYQGIRQTHCRFLIDWFDFDRKLRLAKVAYLEGKPVTEEFPELDKAEIIFKVEDLFQRSRTGGFRHLHDRHDPLADRTAPHRRPLEPARSGNGRQDVPPAGRGSQGHIPGNQR